MREVLEEADMKREQKNKNEAVTTNKKMKKPKVERMIYRKEINHLMLKKLNVKIEKRENLTSRENISLVCCGCEE